MALNYFEPYLMDNLDNEPDMINFSLYNPVANAEIKLEQLVMKENHKLTKFFVEFYCILSHLQYNKQGLLQKAYLALPKRIKDKMVHFEKLASLVKLQNLVQKISQCYWEHKLELSCETLSIPKMDGKSKKIQKGQPTAGPKAEFELQLEFQHHLWLKGEGQV
jgi:hypothetical protein